MNLEEPKDSYAMMSTFIIALNMTTEDKEDRKALKMIVDIFEANKKEKILDHKDIIKILIILHNLSIYMQQKTQGKSKAEQDYIFNEIMDTYVEIKSSLKTKPQKSRFFDSLCKILFFLHHMNERKEIFYNGKKIDIYKAMYACHDKSTKFRKPDKKYKTKKK